MTKKNNPKNKMAEVAEGIDISKKEERRLDKEAGDSDVGKYKNVKPDEFVGEYGGASEFSYPINTLERAKAAIREAHFAPDPEGIKKAVYERYPELKPNKDSK